MNLKLKRIFRRGSSILLLLLLITCTQITAFAQKSASIALTSLPEDAAVSISLWKVAVLENDNAFHGTGDFAEFTIPDFDMKDAASVRTAAEETYSYVQEQKIACAAADVVKNGTISFKGLEAGLYLAAQTSGFEQLDMQKLLVAVPCDDGEGVTWDVTLQPKYTIPEPPPVEYSGEIQITKKTFKGSDAYQTNKIYYAAVFEDKACTKQYGDVIALNMGGKSETTVSVPVYIGTGEDAKKTYYVAETDEKGNPLKNGKDLGFSIQISDKGEVTLTADSTEKEVVINNIYNKEVTPPVKTGDQAPIVGYLLLLVVGLAGFGFVVYRRRRH